MLMATEPATTTTMRAMARRDFGGPEVLELREVDKPVPADDEVLVRVHAASVNPFDWHILTGLPYLARIDAGFRKPKNELIGVDFAGVVDSVGANVTQFQPGDEVFGGRSGAFAEYVQVREDRAIAPKPAGLSFEQAATIGIAGITALEGLRDKGRLIPGQRVLVNGASGGVGTFAVQLAKWMGAEVTAVCSTRNVEQAGSLGADRVIDYTQEDFTKTGERYDLILDIAGNRSWRAYRRVLKDDGRLVIIGGPKKNRLVGPLASRLPIVLRSRLGRQRAVMFMASMNKEDLLTIARLVEDGTVTPVVERLYRLEEVPEAMRYIGAGHARGKLVVTI